MSLARLTRPVIAGTVLAALVATTVAAAAASGGPGTRLLTLRNDVLPGLSRLQDLGPTDPATALQVGVTVDRPDPAGELAAYRAIYDPASPHFHDFFTPSSFAARFGVPEARYAAVRGWATSTGLQVVTSSASRDYLLLEGSAKQVERLVGVQLRDYRWDGKRIYANTAAPRVPAGLGVSGVIGLNSALGMHVFSRPGARPAQDTCGTPAVDCVGLTTPQDLWSIYDQPSTNRGAGQSMAIFGEGQTDPVIKDLRLFEKNRGLPRMPVRVVSVGDDFKSTDGSEEWDIDTQSSSGMAPDAYGMSLYFGKDLSDAAVEAVFSKWAGDKNGPLQASASYGECEEAPAIGTALDGSGAPVGTAGDMFTKAAEQTLRAATMMGKTLFASSGDQGGSCYYGFGLNGVLNNGVPLMSYPAASPYAVSVGGTVLYSTGGKHPQRTQEYAWTFTGGGNSPFIAQPAYQQGVATISGVSAASPLCLSSPDGSPDNTGKPCRVVPDVAAQSGDIATNGYAIVANGADNTPGGGTSLSSPLTLGMWTRIQAAAPAKHGRFVGLGFANEALYRQARKALVDGADFFDVTLPPGGNGQYQPFPRSPADPTGYDAVSGLGVPDVKNLMQHLTGRLTPAHPVKAPAAVDTFRPCPAGGVIADPSGDATSVAGLADAPAPASDPGLDITRAFVTYDAGSKALTFHIRLLDLAGGYYPARYFRDYFSYEGRQFYANPEQDASGATTFSLVEQGSLTGGSATLATGLKGAFDTKASEVREIVPLAVFNAKAKPKRALAPGARLDGLDVLAQRPTSVAGAPGLTLTADEANGGGCPFSIPTTTAAARHAAAAPAQAGTAVEAVAVTRLAATGQARGASYAALAMLLAGLGAAQAASRHRRRLD